ncbi:hypothetical protein BV22DRAFT_1048038 [Leucogyrophana mollusca]|uniref:Uncharacterized protein n=1 Tax=Leucogyrophana mollusca TaxID=85980 RepID=A0ACB8BFN1_9AGAM|nr:hypothetical protein BV22DRAFT_1048038 [Leucogyrophana mollusca]
MWVPPGAFNPASGPQILISASLDIVLGVPLELGERLRQQRISDDGANDSSQYNTLLIGLVDLYELSAPLLRPRRIVGGPYLGERAANSKRQPHVRCRGKRMSNDKVEFANTQVTSMRSPWMCGGRVVVRDYESLATLNCLSHPGARAGGDVDEGPAVQDELTQPVCHRERPFAIWWNMDHHRRADIRPSGAVKVPEERGSEGAYVQTAQAGRCGRGSCMMDALDAGFFVGVGVFVLAEGLDIVFIWMRGGVGQMGRARQTVAMLEGKSAEESISAGSQVQNLKHIEPL